MSKLLICVHIVHPDTYGLDTRINSAPWSFIDDWETEHGKVVVHSNMKSVGPDHICLFWSRVGQGQSCLKIPENRSIALKNEIKKNEKKTIPQFFHITMMNNHAKLNFLTL